MLPLTWRLQKKDKNIRKPMEPNHKGIQGFGLPRIPLRWRHLNNNVEGAPFFHFENVATIPKGEWTKIQHHIYDIEAKFYDFLHFSTCQQSQGYIHNLSMEGRMKILLDPPMTNKESMPKTQTF
jgi:hypothetical protein